MVVVLLNCVLILLKIVERYKSLQMYYIDRQIDSCNLVGSCGNVICCGWYVVLCMHAGGCNNELSRV